MNIVCLAHEIVISILAWTVVPISQRNTLFKHVDAHLLAASEVVWLCRVPACVVHWCSVCPTEAIDPNCGLLESGPNGSVKQLLVVIVYKYVLVIAVYGHQVTASHIISRSLLLTRQLRHCKCPTLLVSGEEVAELFEEHPAGRTSCLWRESRCCRYLWSCLAHIVGINSTLTRCVKP